MKKWFLAVFVLVALLLLAAVYLLIPSSLTVSAVQSVKCNVNGASNYLGQPGNWSKWWPSERAGAAGDTGGKAERPAGAAVDPGIYYQVRGGFYHGLEVAIGGIQDSTIDSRLAVIAVNKDSSVLHWECDLSTGANPFKRIRQYRQAGTMRAGMQAILSRLGKFLESNENTYGIAIREVSTRDTLLTAIRMTFPAPPTTAGIYVMVDKLKSYIAAEGARESGYPMVNVTAMPDGQYQTMVAIPVDKLLSGKGDIFSRRLVPGKFLAAEVRGGINAVRSAQGQVQNYMSDYQRTAMAIPFQSLVTDRSREPDSSKWVTRLYYPVF